YSSATKSYTTSTKDEEACAALGAIFDVASVPVAGVALKPVGEDGVPVESARDAVAPNVVVKLNVACAPVACEVSGVVDETGLPIGSACDTAVLTVVKVEASVPVACEVLRVVAEAGVPNNFTLSTYMTVTSATSVPACRSNRPKSAVAKRQHAFAYMWKSSIVHRVAGIMAIYASLTALLSVLTGHWS
ncbi:MAG: hypothetical protein ACKPKO_10255, partial [Candidatus Fonsibacter sp.]